MSRLLVKNLPAYLTQQRLREHFESKDGPGGTLTDVKVVLKPDGTSRRFGFVGFKTDAEAEKARKWFDRTFVDSTRINVTVVDGAKDAPAPRPNKRPRLGPSPDEEESTVKAATKKTKRAEAPVAESSKDSQFTEFAKVMKARNKKGPSWANDDETQPVASTSTLPPPRPKKQSAAEPKVSEDGPEDSEESPANTVSDMDWFKRHQTTQVDIPEPEKETVFDQSGEEDVEMTGDEPLEVSVAEEEKPEDPTKSTILQTSRLFLRNLSYACTDEELMSLFKPFGEVSQVHIPLDATTKAPKGVAYVSFADPTNAVAAYEALDKKSFQGRLLHILPAVDRRGKPEVVDADGKKTLKDERDAKRKGTAGKEFNWAMLYMNSDAVVSSIADRMNVSKADILNSESDNAAVKLALAETHVIQETKSFLESHGVVLSALEGISRVARSDTTILVKNIPYGTSVEQIRELFEPHGELRHVLVPPAGTMAVVEFQHPDEGRRAFKAVAYRRLGNSIIYLEKGPIGMFVTDGGEASSTATGVQPVTIADSAETTEEPSLASGSTLFVKNLAFSTSTERLVQVFRNLPSFAFARVQMKPDPKRSPGSNAQLSMGYGFVGFKDVEGAKKAIKSMQGYVLDGHALVVKFAGRGAEPAQDPEKAKSTTTKMIVKNVPFEATKKDIRELFGSQGQLKSVRLPKKFDHKSRGFAFLDFLTRREAENAYAALKHTHLLGRHLVLEWAEEAETDIDELRKKAGVGFGGGKELPGKKRKVEIGDGNEDEDMET
ncbi:Multiple RNA-binding domain-containing protein 1 [Steccherinum ochraceum]|uniref:Multiple RNA-binding domain-containing protein 1 n=1 Tax=Steccherinum ochraceum TaxID=92696 RepID=A0A4R0R2P0_9APHY|nr:Multiple RNA-binding domain-containing protein 1 [Steccherinum ochraceum]